jgi:adenosine kinase
MRSLICGSIAFDTIMVFRDRFKNHILPEQIHILNVAFLVPDMRREFGGCAGNIAYSLAMLGGSPVIMATVGDDAAPYLERLDRLGLSREAVQQVAGTYTAQAFITTDLDDNQITAFHPGAMNDSHLNSVHQVPDIGLGIVSPDGREGMLRHAQEFVELGIPFIFDPGQGLPMFTGEELLRFIDQADYVTVNDYEGRLLQERCGQPLEQLARRVRALVVTLGGEGARIYAGARSHDIAAVRPRALVDPTGCGDAFRAGLIYALQRGLDWPVAGRLAALVGSIKIEHRGGQNHRFSQDDIVARYRECFGAAPW